MGIDSQNRDINKLSEQCCGNDESVARTAFTQLVSDSQDRLLAMLFSKTNDYQLAQDVMNETLRKAWLNRKKFTDYGHANGYLRWLFTIANNQLRDTYRKLATSKLDRNIDVTWEEQDTSLAGLARLVRAEQLKALKECLDDEGGAFVQALRMRLAGMSPLEIMDSINQENPEQKIKIGTVSGRISRGKQQVQNCVQRKLP